MKKYLKNFVILTQPTIQLVSQGYSKKSVKNINE